MKRQIFSLNCTQFFFRYLTIDSYVRDFTWKGQQQLIPTQVVAVILFSAVIRHPSLSDPGGSVLMTSLMHVWT